MVLVLMIILIMVYLVLVDGLMMDLIMMIPIIMMMVIVMMMVIAMMTMAVMMMMAETVMMMAEMMVEMMVEMTVVEMMIGREWFVLKKKTLRKLKIRKESWLLRRKLFLLRKEVLFLKKRSVDSKKRQVGWSYTYNYYYRPVFVVDLTIQNGTVQTGLNATTDHNNNGWSSGQDLTVTPGDEASFIAGMSYPCWYPKQYVALPANENFVFFQYDVSQRESGYLGTLISGVILMALAIVLIILAFLLF